MSKSSVIKIYILIFLSALAGRLQAQTIAVTLDRDKIVIGEQVTLQLKITDVNARENIVTDWFHFADTGNHIVTVKKDPIDTIDVNGLTTYLQKITITSFDSGKWALPLLTASIQEISTGKKTTLKANDLFIEVLPVDVSGMQDYHDIKAIIPVEAPLNIWLYVAIAATVIIVVVLLVLIFRKKKKPAEIKQVVLKGTALFRAMQQLDLLQQQHPNTRQEVKTLYTAVETVARNYINEMLHVRSMQATTDELMMFVNVYLQSEQLRTPFFQLLRLIAAVKYAKFIPAEEQQPTTIQTMRATLQYIDGALNEVKKYAQ